MGSSLVRSRWAAIGAAVAVTLGAGGGLVLYAHADSAASSFVSITPCRLFDTRPMFLVGDRSTPLGSSETFNRQVRGTNGACTIPAAATGISYNLTVADPTVSGFIKLYPSDAPVPNASAINPVANGGTKANSGIVGLSATGGISFFNQTGPIDALLDITGYFLPASAGPAGPAGPANNKFISLDIFATPPDTATFTSGFGFNAGLSFTHGASQAGSFHFVLPPDYTAGTTIVATFTWHTAAVSCGVDWRANYVSVSRAGAVHIAGGSATTGMSDPGLGLNGATLNLVQTATFNLTSPVVANPLSPGDSYTFGLFRDGTAGADTCTGAALIDSMVIRYQ